MKFDLFILGFAELYYLSEILAGLFYLSEVLEILKSGRQDSSIMFLMLRVLFIYSSSFSFYDEPG
jgi:hypothetical protein